jgi:hypothetical protein
MKPDDDKKSLRAATVDEISISSDQKSSIENRQWKRDAVVSHKVDLGPMKLSLF